MRNFYYILEGKTPVAVSDVREWREWLKRPHQDRIVQKTQIGDVEVSTVFLATDRRWFGNGPSLLFETMIFGGERDGDMWRYSTWEEAEAGHNKVVAAIKTEEKLSNV